MQAHLTKREVDKYKPGSKRLYVWDNDPKGFGLLVYPNGQKVFVLRYRGPLGRRRWTVGAYGVLTVGDARERAVYALAKLRDGVDPLEAEQEKREMPTFRTWVEEYLKTIQERKKRPYNDRYHLEGPPGGQGHEAKESPAMERWAKRPLDSITARDVEAWLQALGQKGKINANRAYASLRACMESAIHNGILRDNPCRFVKKFPENPPRQRVLNDKEQAQLDNAIDELANPSERAFFRLLRETGCRKNEALTARWEDIDVVAGVWTIPSPKAGRPQSMPLPQRTVLMLRGLKRKGDWVFPGRTKGTHRTEVKRLWEKLKTTAKLDGVTIHDLRRTYGLAAARSAGILAASKLLRHSDTRITAKVYAPLGVEELRAVAEDIVSGNVLPMRRESK